MTDAVMVAAMALGMAAINMIGSVLMLWIRASYRWSNGDEAPKGRRPAPPA